MARKKKPAAEGGICKQAAKIADGIPEADDVKLETLPARIDPSLTAFARRILKWWENLPEEERERIRRKRSQNAVATRNTAKE